MNTLFTPHNDKILVRPVKAETTTASGLVVSGADNNQTEFGDAVAVGPGRVLDGVGQRLAPLVKPGDRILYNKFAGMLVTIAGEELTIIAESDVLGVVSIVATPSEVEAK